MLYNGSSVSAGVVTGTLGLGVDSHPKPEGGLLAIQVFEVGFSPCVSTAASDGPAISKGPLVILGLTSRGSHTSAPFPLSLCCPGCTIGLSPCLMGHSVA